MSDADNYAAMDMAHEFCENNAHCDKWHCPFNKTRSEDTITVDATGKVWQRIETDHGTIAYYCNGILVSDVKKEDGEV